MRPLHLTLEGFRSFRSAVEIDFGGRDQIAVVGDTGAGKSSILEAMVYALYGESSSGRRAGELMNDTSRMLRVVLRFRVGSSEWEVARVVKRTQRGGTGPVSAMLTRVGAGGEALELVEQVRAVNERVTVLLGLDCDAFLRTVILPQGRFARLLVEDGPAHRSKILRQVWHTDDLERMGAFAGQRLAELRELRAEIHGVARSFTEDPAAQLRDLEGKETEAARIALAAERDEQAARGASEEMALAEELLGGARRASARMRPERLDAVADSLERAASDLSRISAEEAASRDREVEIDGRLSAIPTDDGPDEETATTARERLGDITPLASRAVKATEELRRSVVDLDEKKACAEENARVEETVRGQLESAEAAKSRSATTAQEARSRLEEQTRAYDACRQLHDELTRRSDRVAILLEERRKLVKRVAHAMEANERAKARWRESARVLELARRADSAAAAAHGLSPGDDCPVCDRELPAAWDAPGGSGMDEAEQTARAAEALARKTERARTELSEQQRASVEAIAASEQELEATRIALAGALDRLEGRKSPLESDGSVPDAASRPVLPLPTKEDALASHRDRTNEADAELTKHEEALEEIRDQMTRAARAAASAKTDAEAARETHDRFRRGAQDRIDELAEKIRSVPKPYQPDLVVETDPFKFRAPDGEVVAAQAEAANERRRVLRNRNDLRESLRSKKESVLKRREQLARERRSEVEEPINGAVRTLDRFRVEIADCRRDLDMETNVGVDLPPPDARSEGGLGKVRERVERQRRAMTQLAVEASRLLREAEERIVAGRRRLAEVARKMTRVDDEASDEGRAPRAASTEDDGASYAGRLPEAADAEDDGASDEGRATRAADAEDEGASDEGRAPKAAHATELDPKAVVEWAAAAAERARYKKLRASEERAQFAAVVDDVLELHALVEETDRRERALADLDTALKDGAFLKWLTLRRSRALLVCASEILGEMTGGRYAFVDPEDRADRWEILDNSSGQPRSPGSLSGGEQFIGSLALALGMVEMMARSGGRLESLFLDEGFGSLDASNLDAAVDSLTAVAGRGRMVGVISHIRAVAERIDDVLVVDRTEKGSRARWRSGPATRELAKSDAAAAWEGLLD